MKKKFLAVLSFVFMFALVLFGCNSIRLSGGPAYNETVYGNGGSAVVKGDYLYFANAFLDYSVLGHNDNVYDEGSNFKLYGIYRTKLDGEGKVALDSEGVPNKAELLTYNIGGYEYAGLYIFGNYLYYTTPYSNTTDSNETKTGRVRVERVALDGTAHEIVCKFEDYTSECEYRMIYIDGNVFILYKTSESELKLISIDARKNKKETSIATSITSYALFDQKDIEADNVVEAINQYVYYVVKEDDSYYVIYRVNLLSKNKESEEFYRSSSEIVLKEVKNNRVYYTEGGYLYSRINQNVSKKYSSISTTSSDSVPSSISSYVVLEGALGNLDRGILGINKFDSNYYVTYFNGNVSSQINLAEDTTKSITFVATQGEYVFYQVDGDSALYRVKLDYVYSNGTYDVDVDKTIESITKIATTFSTSVNDKTMLDYDSSRIFVYESVDSSTDCYLTMYMIDETLAYKDGDSLVGQYIGNK